MAEGEVTPIRPEVGGGGPCDTEPTMVSMMRMGMAWYTSKPASDRLVRAWMVMKKVEKLYL